MLDGKVASFTSHTSKAMILILAIVIVSLYGLLHLVQMIRNTPLRNIDENGYLRNNEDELLQ